MFGTLLPYMSVLCYTNTFDPLNALSSIIYLFTHGKYDGLTRDLSQVRSHGSCARSKLDQLLNRAISYPGHTAGGPKRKYGNLIGVFVLYR